MKKQLLSGLAVLALGSMIFTGCGSSAPSTDKESPAAATTKSTKIAVIGSTTIAEPMEGLVKAYKATGNTDEIEVQGNGSSAGIKAAIDGTADIGMASRELTAEEKSSGLKETPIAYDGITVVVNPSNGVTDLSTEQVKEIFEGKITNWKEVGGADKDIVVVTREAGSGTRGAFEELLGLLDESKASTIADTALVSEGTGAVMATVATKEASIGFVSLGFIDDTVKPLSIDGVVPSVEAIKAKEYTISRPLLLVTQPDVKPEAQALIDFILGDEAQKLMAEDYISVAK